MSLCWNNDTKHTNTRKDQVMERLMGKLSRETHNRERKNKTKLSQSVGKVKGCKRSAAGGLPAKMVTLLERSIN